MCRLIAYLGAPVSVRDIVFGGEHSLYHQSWQPRELLSGSVNADGYGVVWYTDGRPARIADPRPIWHDPELPETLSALRSGCVVAALRNATPGIPVDRSGLLPLLFERWCFVLNGFVPDFRSAHMRALRASLPDELYAELGGASDSETLFLLAVAALRRGASMEDALEEVARAVVERLGDEPCQLNMLLSDGTRLAVTRTGTVVETNSLYVAGRPPLAPEGVVVASEPPEAGAEWSVVDGHHRVVVHEDARVETEALVLR